MGRIGRITGEEAEGKTERTARWAVAPYPDKESRAGQQREWSYADEATVPTALVRLLGEVARCISVR